MSRSPPNSHSPCSPFICSTTSGAVGTLSEILLLIWSFTCHYNDYIYLPFFFLLLLSVRLLNLCSPCCCKQLCLFLRGLMYYSTIDSCIQVIPKGSPPLFLPHPSHQWANIVIVKKDWFRVSIKKQLLCDIGVIVFIYTKTYMLYLLEK